jgi:Fe-S cluster biogenesis protein NfuA
LETRVAHALDKLRPRLHKQGGSAELLGIDGGVVRLKLSASGHGCGNGPDALKQIVEQAILEVAPEIGEVKVEGLPASAPAFVPLSTIQPLQRKEQRL